MTAEEEVRQETLQLFQLLYSVSSLFSSISSLSILERDLGFFPLDITIT